MQIYHLKLFNIGPLVGEHCIDFAHLTQVSSGLFSISGATGSGKSTILSAITLALYGRAHKSEVRVQDLISSGEYISYSDVILSLNGSKYTFCWRGELIKGKIIHDHYVTQNNKRLDLSPIEIIPLNLKHFCQTAILHQGEFAKYLLGNYSERKNILAQFIQEEELDRFVSYLKSQFDTHQNLNQELSSRYNQLTLDCERFDSFKLNAKKIELENLLTDIEPMIKQIGQLHAFCRDLRKILFDYQELQKRQLKNQNDLKPLLSALAILNDKRKPNELLADKGINLNVFDLYQEIHQHLNEVSKCLKKIELQNKDNSFDRQLTEKIKILLVDLESQFSNQELRDKNKNFQEEIDWHQMVELEKSIHYLKNQQGLLKEGETSIWRNFFQTLSSLKNFQIMFTTSNLLPAETKLLIESLNEVLLKIKYIQDIENHHSLLEILQFLEDTIILNLKDKLNGQFKNAKHEYISLLPLLKIAEEKTSEKNKIEHQLKSFHQMVEKIEVIHRHCTRDEFKNFWLQKVEENLLYLANLELLKIYDGRYQIFSKRYHQGYGLYLNDSKFPNLPRRVNTLSGGEAFLVSLCLSLALSAMTYRKQNCEFFFIDEGFGSLDRDALDQALEVLTHLVIRGKTVGVISHITELAEIIPTKVLLLKNAFGHSHLKVIESNRAELI